MLEFGINIVPKVNFTLTENIRGIFHKKLFEKDAFKKILASILMLLMVLVNLNLGQVATVQAATDYVTLYFSSKTSIYDGLKATKEKVLNDLTNENRGLFKNNILLDDDTKTVWLIW